MALVRSCSQIQLYSPRSFHDEQINLTSLLPGDWVQFRIPPQYSTEWINGIFWKWVKVTENYSHKADVSEWARAVVTVDIDDDEPENGYWIIEVPVHMKKFRVLELEDLPVLPDGPDHTLQIMRLVQKIMNKTQPIGSYIPNLRHKQLSSWTSRDVAVWLATKSYNLNMIRKFVYRSVTGSILTRLRNPQDLQTRVGIGEINDCRRAYKLICALRDKMERIVKIKMLNELLNVTNVAPFICGDPDYTPHTEQDIKRIRSRFKARMRDRTNRESVLADTKRLLLKALAYMDSLRDHHEHSTPEDSPVHNSSPRKSWFSPDRIFEEHLTYPESYSKAFENRRQTLQDIGCLSPSRFTLSDIEESDSSDNERSFEPRHPQYFFSLRSRGTLPNTSNSRDSRDIHINIPRSKTFSERSRSSRGRISMPSKRIDRT